jgi:hypothetical protein
MVTVHVVQVAVDQIIRMVAVRNWFVAAAGTVLVSFVMRFARVLGSTVRWIVRANLNHVLVDVIAMNVVQATIVKVIRMTMV